MTRLLIVGPPGAGKGTQSVRITAAFDIPAIATGDIFRANIKNQTELGKQVSAIINAGDYVPDSLTNDLVASRLKEDDCAGGFLLDVGQLSVNCKRLARRLPLRVRNGFLRAQSGLGGENSAGGETPKDR